jgi:hypothetical protein
MADRSPRFSAKGGTQIGYVENGGARQKAGQRVMIQPGRAGEKRRANSDDGDMAFGGIVRGNAPITKAAKTPNSKPKIILRTGDS